MRVSLNRSGAASEAQITDLETALGQKLDPEFKDFVGRHDGAEPGPNVFRVQRGLDSGVNAFIPVNQIAHERSLLEPIGFEAYPIAWAEGGNYVVIERRAVFFWDHEAPMPMHKIAEDFGTFLGNLKPLPKVELKPGQVRDAWIDPELLKQDKE